MTKVVALVDFEDRAGLVLDKKPVFTYTRHDDVIIGIDKSGVFVSCYSHLQPKGSMKAFGGREFDITLDTGEVIHCNGQWWDGGYRTASKILGEKFVSTAVSTKQDLYDCYVFTGYQAIANKVKDLVAEYNGDMYPYDDYLQMLKVDQELAQ